MGVRVFTIEVTLCRRFMWGLFNLTDVLAWHLFFSGRAAIKVPQAGWLKQESVFPKLWRLEPKIRFLVGLILSEGCEGKSVPSLSPTF